MIVPQDSVPSTLRTRSSLLFRLRNWDDEKSWQEFYALYRKLVYKYARRSGLSHEEAEEATNDVFIRVAKTIHEFEPNPEKGPFRGWLLNLARWRVYDKFRDRPRDRPAQKNSNPDGRTSTIERIPDPSAEGKIWDEEWQNSLFSAAMERIARRAKPRHFQVFELYARQQWSIARISSELSVNAAAIYLINHRLTKQLKSEVSKLREQAG